MVFEAQSPCRCDAAREAPWQVAVSRSDPRQQGALSPDAARRPACCSNADSSPHSPTWYARRFRRTNSISRRCSGRRCTVCPDISSAHLDRAIGPRSRARRPFLAGLPVLARARCNAQHDHQIARVSLWWHDRGRERAETPAMSPRKR